MPHTTSRYMQSLGFNDARIFAGLGDIVVTTSAGTVTPTRTALGNYNYAIAASTTTFFAINATQAILRRTGFFEDLQEQFGGAGIAGEAAPQLYRPDVLGAMNTGQELQPRTNFRKKGFRVLGFDTIYTVTTNPMTTLQSSVYMTNFTNNTAVTPAAIVTQAANGLTNVAQANPYVSPFSIPVAGLQSISNPAGGPPGYLFSADQALWIELAVVTPAGGTGTFYGFDIQVEFNFN
jgi:hypothetical protein